MSSEFRVKRIKNDNITVEEEKDGKKNWLFLFWRKYGNIFSMILIFLAITSFTVGIGIALSHFFDNANKKVDVEIKTVVEYYNEDGKLLFENTYPMSEKEADIIYNNKDATEAEFVIKNMSSMDIRCRIGLEKTKNTTMETNKLNYKLIKNGEPLKSKSLNYTKKIPEAELLVFDMKPAESDKFALRLWLDESADNSYQDKIFEGKIKVYFEYKKK
ncbi:MAG: hypothetical protein MRZ37_03830 [Tenericutes bacterium]|nr:hypothetical protein [Mycoplasmatota bacterium]